MTAQPKSLAPLPVPSMERQINSEDDGLLYYFLKNADYNKEVNHPTKSKRDASLLLSYGQE